ncbi:MAG: hypothetical protein EOP00_16015 [Pedobacter sp.]|nr:MAG: hypothetical protein EOP00_16015 [Pedobacter sp.]
MNGVSYQQFMQFAPQNVNPIDADEYFYVYNYQYLIYLVNPCLASCVNGLSAITSVFTNEAPTMSFDLKRKNVQC